MTGPAVGLGGGHSWILFLMYSFSLSLGQAMVSIARDKTTEARADSAVCREPLLAGSAVSPTSSQGHRLPPPSHYPGPVTRSLLRSRQELSVVPACRPREERSETETEKHRQTPTTAGIPASYI